MKQSKNDVHLIGAMSDPIFAMQKLEKEWPDVIVLDVEIPRMDGITSQKYYGRTPHAGGNLFCSHGKKCGNHHMGAYRWSS